MALFLFEPLLLAGVDAEGEEEEAGIGLSEEAGIGLAAPAQPVDFVISPPYWRLPRRAARRADNQDRGDLREMMQMYSEWRMAA